MLRVKNTRNSSLSPLQMPAKKKAKETAAQVKTLEAQLWDAADKMPAPFLRPTTCTSVLAWFSCATSPLRLSERKMS
jgi:hypothetical protein